LTDKQKKCKWYDVCPMKRFYEQGRLDRRWVEDYCFHNGRDCVRKKMEEEGRYHPDNRACRWDY